MTIQIPSRYKITPEKLRGGFGEALLCIDTHLNRFVIIKKIVIENEKERLLDEIKALQNIKSNHIVEIYDIITDDNSVPVGIVEEFIPGKDLSDVHMDIDTDNFYKILYQISCATHDMHKCNVVHRDIKPNNMKWTKTNIIKFYDLNLAKYELLPATTMSLAGTKGFMAPELFFNPPLIDTSVDIYALGCTAYCIAKGSPPDCACHMPPNANDTNELISDYVTVSDKTDEIIKSCLHLDPSKRPNATELLKHFKSELLYGKHKAIFRTPIQNYEIQSPGHRVRVGNDETNVVIQYDGYNFIIRSHKGSVTINNEPVSVGEMLSGSTLITIGEKELGARRLFVTFDISHPEVLL